MLKILMKHLGIFLRMSFDMGKRKIKLVVITTGYCWSVYSVSKLDAGVFLSKGQ